MRRQAAKAPLETHGMDIKQVVYITLEYCVADLFSGNGVCARSQVRGLAQLDVSVLVICGRPRSGYGGDKYVEMGASPKITVQTVPLDVWNTTDRDCAHHQFAEGAAVLLSRVDWTRVETVFGVDWTGMGTVRYLTPEVRRVMPPIMYLNFRVYVSMSNIEEDERQFYRSVEGWAVSTALTSGGGVVSLCNADCETLRQFDNRDLDGRADTGESDFLILLPMLREEFSVIARNNADHILNPERKRRYLVSLVRLSVNKGAQRYVQMLEHITEKDPQFWSRTGVVPLMCGAESQPEFAKEIKARLMKSIPGAVLMDSFLNPQELSTVLQDSILNVHPAIYEAYGMTMVEAASMGCPSVLHVTGIGAAALLRPDGEASVTVNVDDPESLAKTVCSLINDNSRRQRLVHSAYKAAVSWTEREHVQKLLDFTQQIIRKTAPPAASRK